MIAAYSSSGAIGSGAGMDILPHACANRAAMDALQKRLPNIDLALVVSGLELLPKTSTDGRLLALKNLVINNGGIWAVPESPADYQPVIYEISLGGIPAVDNDPKRLPENWMRAANNILTAIEANP
ncbi:MAG: hypothetical protein ACRBB0_27185 [Pelagimonas sp.]|uniref:hypothetical protein n=1 Tax=Pelagimonas sp. TaxID=2073170 RepID=UPI003D6B7D81